MKATIKNEMRGAGDLGDSNGYVMPGPIKRSAGSGGSLRFTAAREPWLGAPTNCTAYVVKSGSREWYAKNKEKALRIAADMLLYYGSVEIKRIEFN